MQTREFLMQTRLDARMLETWIEAGWLLPRGSVQQRDFLEIDLARAQLIRDLRDDIGINDEAIPVVLQLIDQVHGLRRVLRDLMAKRYT